MPGAHEEFIPKTGRTGNTAEQLVQEQWSFRASLSCEGPFGEAFSCAGVADWRDLVEHVWGAGQRRKFDPTERVAKSLEKVAESLTRAVGFDGVKVISYTEQLQRDAANQAAIESEPEDASPARGEDRPAPGRDSGSADQ